MLNHLFFFDFHSRIFIFPERTDKVKDHCKLMLIPTCHWLQETVICMWYALWIPNFTHSLFSNKHNMELLPFISKETSLSLEKWNQLKNLRMVICNIDSSHYTCYKGLHTMMTSTLALNFLSFPNFD